MSSHNETIRQWQFSLQFIYDWYHLPYYDFVEQWGDYTVEEADYIIEWLSEVVRYYPLEEEKV